MIALNQVAAIGAVAIVALASWPGSAEAAGACPGALRERTLDLSDARVTSFGTLGKFAPLPLEKGEYVLTFDDGPRKAEDWRGDAPQNSLKRLRQRLNTVDRGVIVMHDVKNNTVPLLPMALDELRARDASIVHLVE